MKKFPVFLALILTFSCAWIAHADIAVTQGSGKTVATTTDNSREFQNVVVTTQTIFNDVGVPTPIGYKQTISSYVPVAIQAGSIANTGFNVNNSPTVNQGTAGTADWHVTLSTAQVYNVSIDTINGQYSDNGAAAATNRATTLPGIYQNNYLNGTAATQGRNAAHSIGTDGLLWTAALPSMRPAGFLASTGTITSAASGTDIACLYGNASNTVLVTGMRVSGTQTTAGNVHLVIIKRSTADVGVFSTMTVTAEDSTMNVGVSSAVWFTANPTLGTAVGIVSDYDLGVLAAATATPNDIWISPASWRMRPIVLRGVAQGLCANLNGVTVTGGSFTVSYEYLEVTTISP
jgi:hypothetical protein